MNLFYCVFLAVALSSHADVVLDAESYFTVASGRVDEYKDSLGKQIQLGFLDARRESIVISEAESTGMIASFVQKSEAGLLVEISKNAYLAASDDLRSRMQEALLPIMGGVSAYIAFVDVENSTLSDEPIVTRLHPGVVYRTPIQVHNLLSSFARRWANRSSKKTGPNCFFNAIAAINQGWALPRYMSEREFVCHLSRDFVRIQVLEKFGDILVLLNERGIPEHAAVYVGSTRDGKQLLFTKNGKTPGSYLLMDADTLTSSSFLYPDANKQFFRSVRPSAEENCSSKSRKINDVS